MIDVTKGDFGLETHSGVHMDVLHPKPEDFNIQDIAHALSNICRFTGHVYQFYSVAQHSVILARYMQTELKLEALLHDATEAYVSDINHNLKQAMPEYNLIEQLYRDAIAKRFGLEIIVPYQVAKADRELCHYEAQILMPNRGEWAGRLTADSLPIHPVEPRMAYAMFTDMYTILTGQGTTI